MMPGMDDEETGVRFKAIEDVYVHFLSPEFPIFVLATLLNSKPCLWRSEAFGTMAMF